MAQAPSYLEPYLNATKKHGAGFGSLLWASPKTQAVRFAALLRTFDLQDRCVLDAGCGRADFLEFMLNQNIIPRRYIGLEAVGDLANAAEAKGLANCEIVRGDFVDDHKHLEIGPDVILFCGSLNTLEESEFYRTLLAAFTAASCGVAFNFLCSPYLAASSFLTWHRIEAVLAFAGKLSDHVRIWDNYLKGDATVAIGKASP